MTWNSIVIIVVLAVYFAPLMIALVRRQRRGVVAVLNVLLGWTVIGWIVALVFALWPAKQVEYVEVPYSVYDGRPTSITELTGGHNRSPVGRKIGQPHG